jgi:4-diphosphocytidyl-2-C-methyl-D-erythritol kinase
MRAPAKVNLHLEVLKQRPDGYHDVETVLQALTLFDTISVALRDEYPGGEPQIALRVRPHGAAPEDETNLCWRSARLFCRRMRVSGSLEIELEKTIPAGAGLGGGSSDAAAVLVACDRLFGTELETSRLEALAGELGSDVSFFIRGATAVGHGTGSRLTPLPAIRTGQFLVLKPDFELSTSAVYAQLKMGLTVRGPAANIQSIKPLIARFPTGSWFGYNRLEEVVLPSRPELKRTLLRLREVAPIAMLSGSGSAVFAVFGQRRTLTAIVGEFARSFAFLRVVGPHAAGVEIMEERPYPPSDR